MSRALAEALPRTVTAADAVAKTDATISVTVDASGDVSITTDESAGVHVRVLDQGRVGWACGVADEARAVGEAAVAAARAGPVLDLMLPAVSPLPAVATDAPRAASADAADLLPLARGLAERLRRPGRRIEAWAERSAGSVRVTNTRGIEVEYRTTLAGLGVAVATESTPFDGPFRAWVSQCALPGVGEIEGVVTEVERWVGLPVLDEWPMARRQRAWLRPRAVRTLLLPLLQRLTGDAWFERLDDPAPVDERLSLVDDPLVPGRPGSRPICDDGVVTRPLTLVDRGRTVQGIADLQVAARHGVPATGHGRRRILGAPRPGFSNLRVAAGETAPEALPAAVGDGLLVLDLDWGPAPNPAPGVFRARAPWTFLIRGGEIAGRLEGAVLAGNADELLTRVLAVGADADWVGSLSLPSLVIDGIRLERR